MKYETPRNFYSNNSKLLILLLGELHVVLEVADGSLQVGDVDLAAVVVQRSPELGVINLQSVVLQLELLVLLQKVILVELQVPDVDAELHDFLAVLLHGAANSVAEVNFVRRNLRELGRFPGRHFANGSARGLGACALARNIIIEILRQSIDYKGRNSAKALDLPAAWIFLVSAIVADFIKRAGKKIGLNFKMIRKAGQINKARKHDGEWTFVRGRNCG